MNRNLRRALLLLIGTLSLATTIPAAVAQRGYPERPVKVVVPFPPGAMADLLPRLVSEKLAAVLGQPVVVENRPGATGNVGSELVAAALPDGYTLLASPPPPLAINESLYPRLGFDPSAFIPITIIAQVPNVLAVSPTIPAHSVEELVALAKRQPRGLSYASTGSGGTPHLSGEMLRSLSGAPLVHVPYRGIAQAIPDLQSNRVDLMFLNLADALPHARRGVLKLIGVGSEQRHPAIAQVPAIAESLPGFDSTTWYAVVAPQGTPPEIVEKLWKAIAQVVSDPAVSERLHQANLQVVANPPAAARAFIRAEAHRWGVVIRSSGIKLD